MFFAKRKRTRVTGVSSKKLQQDDEKIIGETGGTYKICERSHRQVDHGEKTFDVERSGSWYKGIYWAGTPVPI